MDARVVIGWTTILGIAGAAGIALLLRPGSTDPRLIPSRGLRRALRWYRSLWLRGCAAVAAWPHIGEIMLRTTRSPVVATGSEEIWRDGPARLLRYRSGRTRRTPVLIVHALVSRHWILDLAPDGSVVGALTAEGYDVFLLDFGEPATPEDSLRGFDAYARTLLNAEHRVRELTGAKKIHIVGYCSSASLALARLGALPTGGIASAIMIAPPVDLAAPGGMARLMTNRLVKPALLLDQAGNLPGSIVRESFHLLRPRALRTVLARIRRRNDRTFTERYDPLSQWLWSHRALPGRLVFDTIDLMRRNALVTGDMTLLGRPVSLAAIDVPLLVAIADRDHIVPSGSSAAINSVTGLKVETLHCPSGHVSMITGAGARTVLLPGMLAWLARSEPKPRARRTSKKVKV